LFDTPPSKRDKISIIAIEPVVCYEISKGGLIEALGFNYKEIILFSIFKHIIQNNKYFNLIFGEKQLSSIFKVFRLMRYYNREEIFCKTLAKKRMIIIIDGNIRNQQTKQIIAKTGDIIGEEFFNNKHSQLCPGLIAFPHLITLESEVQQVFNILNLDKECLKQIKEIKKLNRLKRISLFKYLPHDLIEKISNTVTIEKYNKDEKIIVEGENGKFCINKYKDDIYLSMQCANNMHKDEHKSKFKYSTGKLTFLLDTSSIELFIDDGKETISTRFYALGEKYKIRMEGIDRFTSKTLKI
jgi:hypothetical protein